MKTSTLYALMGPRGAGATTMIKMATEMGINYIPVYTTEWLHARSRRGILLKRMEQEEFNQQRFFAQTGWRGFQYGWYKQDIDEATRAAVAALLNKPMDRPKEIAKGLPRFLLELARQITRRNAEFSRNRLAAEFAGKARFNTLKNCLHIGIARMIGRL